MCWRGKRGQKRGPCGSAQTAKRASRYSTTEPLVQLFLCPLALYFLNSLTHTFLSLVLLPLQISVWVMRVCIVLQSWNTPQVEDVGRVCVCEWVWKRTNTCLWRHNWKLFHYISVKSQVQKERVYRGRKEERVTLISRCCNRRSKHFFGG